MVGRKPVSKRRGHHLIFKSTGFEAGHYLHELGRKEFGLQMGFTKNLETVVHVVVVLKNKPAFKGRTSLNEYFQFGKVSPINISKISSSKLTFHAMLPDVCQRLGGRPEHTFNFTETIKRPKLYIMRKIRLGLTLQELREMLFGDVPIELFSELLRNFEDYQTLIFKLDTIKMYQM